MKWLDRIAGWFGYVSRNSDRPFEYPRVNNGQEAIARGQRWQDFYAEEGGMRDMLLDIRVGYFEASAALSPDNHAKLYEHALADRIARELDRKIRTVIETGKIEASRREQANAITNFR